MNFLIYLLLIVFNLVKSIITQSNATKSFEIKTSVTKKSTSVIVQITDHWYSGNNLILALGLAISLFVLVLILVIASYYCTEESKKPVPYSCSTDSIGHISSINSRQFIPNSSSNPSSNNPSSISFK